MDKKKRSSCITHQKKKPKREKDVIKSDEASKRDIIYAMCHDISLMELDEYCQMIFKILKRHKLKELDSIIDNNVMHYWSILPICAKKSIFFSVLNIENCLKEWVCLLNPNRKRPALEKSVAEKFFDGLNKICKICEDQKYLVSDEFLNLIETLYDNCTDNSNHSNVDEPHIIDDLSNDSFLDENFKDVIRGISRSKGDETRVKDGDSVITKLRDKYTKDAYHHF